MTELPPAPASNNNSVFLGIVIGITAGLVLTTCLGSVIGYAVVRKKEVEVRRGWNLVPVVVAAVDVPEGTSVTFDMISQRSVPEQFVTSSVVKPDSASYVVNQRILVPALAGDPLLWTQFEVQKGQLALFAANDLPIGARLADADIEEKPVQADVLTISYPIQADRPRLLGKSVLAPFRRGDPLLWTHFSAVPPPVRAK